MKYLRTTSKFLLMILMSLTLTLPEAAPGEPGESGSHASHAHDHEKKHNQKSSQEAGEEAYKIHFKTHPEPDEIIPDQDMVELMFEVTHEGKVAQDVELSYRVQAPPKTFWFGTDFPIVEGSQLLSGTVHVPDGNQVISMILPIRGQYTVKTTARGSKGVTNKTMNFSVSENPQEIINLSVFLIILFLFGAVGGYFLSGSRSQTSVSSWIIVFVCISGFVVSTGAESVYAHGEGNWDPHTLERQKGVKNINDQYELKTNIFPQPVDVGEMLNIRYSVEGQEGHHDNHSMDEHGSQEENINEGHLADNDEILAESHFVHSEGGLEMVTQSSWLEDGMGSINVQLFDGAPHYLVTRFYRPTERYRPDSGHEHGSGTGKKPSDSREEHAHEKSDHDEHNHGQEHTQGEADKNGDSGHETEKPTWEAESVYEFEAGQYSVRFQESEDPAMKWILLPEGADHINETVHQQFEDCESLESGSSIPNERQCFDLTLQEDGTEFTFTVSEKDHYHLYTEHLPREFDMTIKEDGTPINPEQKFITGKGEFLGRSVKWVDLNSIQPPVDSIVKSLLTLIMAVAFGFFVGYKGPEWIG